jgi:hypothetical protein
LSLAIGVTPLGNKLKTGGQNVGSKATRKLRFNLPLEPPWVIR